MRIKPVRFADSTMLTRSGLVRPDLAAPAIVKRRAFTKDEFMTFDQFTIDSTGSFLIGELERLDPTLHEPLFSVTWPRDIDLREDVTIADEVSSFTNSSFAAPGGINPAGKAWVSKDANAIPGVSLDIGKTSNPLYLWAMEAKWTIPELESARKLGRPVDTQKIDVVKTKMNMDIDEMVYIGDTLFGKTGLLNAASVTVTNAVNGATGSPLWTQKTPDEMLADVNALLNAVWAASGWAVMPDELRLPPTLFTYLVSQKVSNAGNVSIIEFLKANSISNAANGRPLNIQPVKWLTGRGVGGVNRIFAYTRDKERVRYPLVPLQRTPLEFRSLYQIVTFYCRLGVIEIPYPETLGYLDGC